MAVTRRKDPTTMPTFRLPRVSALDLEFEGDLLAEQTSWEEGKTRWTEIRIYRTTSDRFVTELVGFSTVPGERDRRTVKVHDTPDAVARAFEQRSSTTDRIYITDLALDALDQAHERDPRIRAVQSI